MSFSEVMPGVWRVDVGSCCSGCSSSRPGCCCFNGPLCLNIFTARFTGTPGPHACFGDGYEVTGFVTSQTLTKTINCGSSIYPFLTELWNGPPITSNMGVVVNSGFACYVGAPILNAWFWHGGRFKLLQNVMMDVNCPQNQHFFCSPFFYSYIGPDTGTSSLYLATITEGACPEPSVPSGSSPTFYLYYWVVCDPVRTGGSGQVLVTTSFIPPTGYMTVSGPYGDWTAAAIAAGSLDCRSSGSSGSSPVASSGPVGSGTIGVE